MSRQCSADEVREIVASGDGVLVLFYASWCPFSAAFLPVYEKHTRGRDKEVVRIALDGSEDLFEELGVEVYPTVLFFKDGAVSRRLDGKPLAGLKEKQLAELVSSCFKAGG